MVLPTMLSRTVLLLFIAALMVDAAVILPPNSIQIAGSQPTCGCTTTITEYFAQGLLPRQQCPPQTTVTVVVAPPVATIVSGDPASIASSFAYASQIDSMKHQDSSQDRPTGEPPETTPIFYTHTALGPAIVGTDDPNDSSVLYHNIGTTTAPVATTTVSFPAEVTPAQRNNGTGQTRSTHTTWTTIYLSTTTVTPTRVPSSASSNLSVFGQGLQKRQTCSMIFAPINGQWASWCNEWDGHTTIKYSTYNTTVLVTNPIGGDPIPQSVYAPVGPSDVPETVQTSPPQELTSPTMQGSSNFPPTSSTLPNEDSPLVTSIVVTASVVVTYPITTVTQTSSDVLPISTSEGPAATSSCGQVGQFVISFDDLPEFSTSDPNNETTAPPVLDRYNHFYWSKGYGYGPPPNEPFRPNDGKRIAEYNPVSESSATIGVVQGRDLPGSFGAGPRSFNSIYWFDAKSVFIGCNTTNSNAPCDIVASGYRWIRNSAPGAARFEGHEELAFTQHFSLPGPCVANPCSLTQISFDVAKFSGLSTLNIAANLGDTKTGFYLDSFQAAWTNSTCGAGLERSASRK